MLSYQHIYHAGNHVDCQKHGILSALLQCFDRFHYIDTHSGRGLYDLETAEAAKIQEYSTGIDRIWPLNNWPKELRIYQHFLEELNPDGVCRFYPGSPMVALAHAQGDDPIDLYEIHPQELDALQYNMADYPQIRIHDHSGWDMLGTALPSSNIQQVVLIDPSYELKDEYDRIPTLVTNALTHAPEAVFLIWYPMLAAKRHEAMIDDFKTLTNYPVLKNEIIVGDPATAKGLYGTGILCINPPQGFDATMQKISTWLTEAIGISSTVKTL